MNKITPFSGPSCASFMNQLSGSTATQLIKVFTPASSNIIAIWEKIFINADKTHSLSLFEKEILTRLNNPHLLVNQKVSNQFQIIFSSKPDVMNAFLQIATSYKSDYYPENVFCELLESFSHLITKMNGIPFPELSKDLPCYDMGGKEWIKICLESLDKQKYVQDQVDLWIDFPTSEQLQASKKMGFPVVSSRLFHTWAKGVSQPLQAPLSMSRYLAQQMRDLPTNVHRLPMNKYLEIVKLIETEYQHIFAESDRVHLLQIVFLLSLQTEDKSSKFHAILHWFSRTKIELGDSVFLLISNPVSYEKNASLQPVIQMMHYLLGMAPFIDKLMPTLIKFYKKEIGLAELNKSIIQMKREIERAKFPEKN